MKEPRKPDYRLRIKDKETSEPMTVGAGWKNEDGSISIQVSKLIKVELSEKVFVTLFPIEDQTDLKPYPVETIPHSLNIKLNEKGYLVNPL